MSGDHLERPTFGACQLDRGIWLPPHTSSAAMSTAFDDAESGGGLGSPGGAENDSELEVGGEGLRVNVRRQGMIRPASSESSSGFPLSC